MLQLVAIVTKTNYTFEHEKHTVKFNYRFLHGDSMVAEGTDEISSTLFNALFGRANPENIGDVPELGQQFAANIAAQARID